jgi:Fe-S cluster assembly protein SufD
MTALTPSPKLAAVIDRSRFNKEYWRYTNLEKILATPYAPKQVANTTLWDKALTNAVPYQAGSCRLIFLNGTLHKEETHFAHLSHDCLTGNATEGYRLTIAPKTCLVTTPIELVSITDGIIAETGLSLAIDLGASASLKITEHHLSVAWTAATHIPEITIKLGLQAKLEHNKILHTNFGIAHLARTIVHVNAGAFYRNFSLVKDTRLVRNDIDVTLDGKLAQCELNGVMLLRDAEHADTFTHITHAAPHGTSRQLYKTIVKDRAKGTFQGKIIVAKDAQKTDGQQLSRALLLSDMAEMNAKPELEIYADDVSCSHGSTVGDLDADALFYLRARGLSTTDAHALLLRAFINEVIDITQDVGETTHASHHNADLKLSVDTWLNT